MRGWRFEDMRRSHVALRLQESILEEARRVSETEGVALNQFINVAVAEKLSALRTEGYFREHGQRGDVARAKRVLKRAGRGNPPVAGGEVGGTGGERNPKSPCPLWSIRLGSSASRRRGRGIRDRRRWFHLGPAICHQQLVSGEIFRPMMKGQVEAFRQQILQH